MSIGGGGVLRFIPVMHDFKNWSKIWPGGHLVFGKESETETISLKIITRTQIIEIIWEIIAKIKLKHLLAICVDRNK
jgi:hypothetical protein